ncbi:MAG: flagellar biosynthetic protein FliR [Planctomycetota bacterium]
MPWSLANVYLLLPGFALVLFRIAGLFLIAPLFASNAVPARLKVGLALTIAAVVFPLVAPTLPSDITLGAALVGVVGEMLIGLIIGLGVNLVIVGVQMAGMLIGQQAGIALASVVDPTHGESTTVVSQVYMITTMLIFLGLGGHRMLIAALLDTFSVVPVLGCGVGESTGVLLADLLSAAFILAIKLFSPVLIALMLTTLTLAFVSRTMPQLNILSVGFAVRSMAAIGTAALALAASQEVLVRALTGALESVRASLGLGPLGLV